MTKLINRYNIFVVLGLLIMAVSCTTAPQSSNRQQAAYEKCMNVRVKEFPDDSVGEAKMKAHYICVMETGHMDDRYYECMPIVKKMFTADGVGDVAASAAMVCKFYSQACKGNSQHTNCRSGYIAESYRLNPNTVYPGTGLKRADYGSTLLIDLVSSANVETVEAVIKRGANVNESMGGNWTPLAEAKSKGKQELIEMLLRYGAK